MKSVDWSLVFAAIMAIPFIVVAGTMLLLLSVMMAIVNKAREYF